ncbi:MAG TPA: universal stress protein [Nitrososphaerales archaeon]|nr:universal stress protein [Nitrososphaerales archaeon]
MESRWGFEQILVAYDGSEDSKKAVKAACSIAKGMGSKLILLHVYSVPVYSYGGPGGLPQISIQTLASSAKDRAVAIVDEGVKLAEGEGVQVKGEALESASVVEAVVDRATKDKVQLVVLGTRGMTGFKKMLLGSVSSGVVNHSPCPVLVVR